ncbi:MAG: hypothetical protein AB7O88_21830 [Reyranellaceae bacterium]
MFKSITIAALVVGFLAGGLQSASALVSVNGGGDNGWEPQGWETQGWETQGRSAQGARTGDSVSTGMVVIGIELPRAQ